LRFVSFTYVTFTTGERGGTDKRSLPVPLPLYTRWCVVPLQVPLGLLACGSLRIYFTFEHVGCLLRCCRWVQSPTLFVLFCSSWLLLLGRSCCWSQFCDVLLNVGCVAGTLVLVVGSSSGSLRCVVLVVALPIWNVTCLHTRWLHTVTVRWLHVVRCCSLITFVYPLIWFRSVVGVVTDGYRSSAVHPLDAGLCLVLHCCLVFWTFRCCCCWVRCCWFCCSFVRDCSDSFWTFSLPLLCTIYRFVDLPVIVVHVCVVPLRCSCHFRCSLLLFVRYGCVLFPHRILIAFVPSRVLPLLFVLVVYVVALLPPRLVPFGYVPLFGLLRFVHTPFGITRCLPVLRFPLLFVVTVSFTFRCLRYLFVHRYLDHCRCSGLRTLGSRLLRSLRVWWSFVVVTVCPRRCFATIYPVVLHCRFHSFAVSCSVVVFRVVRWFVVCCCSDYRYVVLRYVDRSGLVFCCCCFDTVTFTFVYVTVLIVTTAFTLRPHIRLRCHSTRTFTVVVHYLVLTIWSSLPLLPVLPVRCSARCSRCPFIVYHALLRFCFVWLRWILQAFEPRLHLFLFPFVLFPHSTTIWLPVVPICCCIVVTFGPIPIYLTFGTSFSGGHLRFILHLRLLRSFVVLRFGLPTVTLLFWWRWWFVVVVDVEDLFICSVLVLFWLFCSPLAVPGVPVWLLAFLFATTVVVTVVFGCWLPCYVIVRLIWFSCRSGWLGCWVHVVPVVGLRCSRCYVLTYVGYVVHCWLFGAPRCFWLPFRYRTFTFCVLRWCGLAFTERWNEPLFPTLLVNARPAFVAFPVRCCWCCVLNSVTFWLGLLFWFVLVLLEFVECSLIALIGRYLPDSCSVTFLVTLRLFSFLCSLLFRCYVSPLFLPFDCRYSCVCSLCYCVDCCWLPAIYPLRLMPVTLLYPTLDTTLRYRCYRCYVWFVTFTLPFCSLITVELRCVGPPLRYCYGTTFAGSLYRTRCHRSFLVRRSRLEELRGAERLLFLLLCSHLFRAFPIWCYSIVVLHLLLLRYIVPICCWLVVVVVDVTYIYDTGRCQWNVYVAAFWSD